MKKDLISAFPLFLRELAQIYEKMVKIKRIQIGNHFTKNT